MGGPLAGGRKERHRAPVGRGEVPVAQIFDLAPIREKLGRPVWKGGKSWPVPDASHTLGHQLEALGVKAEAGA